MVSPSPWPLYIGITSFPGVIGLVGAMSGIKDCKEMFYLVFLSFLWFLAMWGRDIIRESTYWGLHTKQVEKNTITGFKLFLFTETMLFVTFFWAHLYSSLYPSVFIGMCWPPVGLTHLLLDPFAVPLINTLILVYSGFTLTVSHLYLRRGDIILSSLALGITILFGLAFLYIQNDEFHNSQFDISDGIYGSTFFMLTGFHGGHVIIGVTGLIITLVRLLDLHFSSYSHTGFKLALIYWHFVDVVWIFVFIIVYVLGSDLTHQDFIFYILDPVSKESIDFIIINYEKISYGHPKAFDIFKEQHNPSNYDMFCFNNNEPKGFIQNLLFKYLWHCNFYLNKVMFINNAVFKDVFEKGFYDKFVNDQNTIRLFENIEEREHCITKFNYYTEIYAQKLFFKKMFYSGGYKKTLFFACRADCYCDHIRTLEEKLYKNLLWDSK